MKPREKAELRLCRLIVGFNQCNNSKALKAHESFCACNAIQSKEESPRSRINFPIQTQEQSKSSKRRMKAFNINLYLCECN